MQRHGSAVDYLGQVACQDNAVFLTGDLVSYSCNLPPFTVEKDDPLTTVPPQEVLSPTHMLPRIKNMLPSPKKNC